MCGTCRQQCTVRVEFPVSFHNPTLPLLWQTCTASLANTRQHLLQEVSQLWEQWVRNVFKHRASTDTSRRNLLVDGRTTRRPIRPVEAPQPQSSAWTWLLSPPKLSWPHVTSCPAAVKAAKAPVEPTICLTIKRRSCTSRLSPPASLCPQLTTLPSSFMAAKAFSVAATSSTFTSCSRTAVMSPPRSGSPQQITSPSFVIAANALPEGMIALAC
mmetsp:Transcript_36490/g.50831  ORF Transcript_36490/g.50831 Transcript_36490/m.50831 type:complete len:214 (+) Transcript_36490:206-847(+)